ncbi:MAG: oligosaccharide flippase family protein [Candidatus Yanofskybacteria bacterium]|nr:oligosaccharide flippase family protein [Candidatus Yanofskybacteria bacterium]
MHKLKEKIDYYRQHWFVRSVATLQAGSFAGTLVQALAGVFLARLLQPELFGVYSLAFGLASLGGLLLGAGTQEAVSTLLGSAYAKQNSEEVKEALAFLIKLTLYAGLITIFLLLFFPMVSNYFYGDPAIGWYAGIVVLAVFLSSSFSAVVQLALQVSGRIKILTLIIFGDQFLRFSISLLFVFLGLGVLGAVAGQFVGAAVIFVISLFIWERLRRQHPIFPSLRGLISDIREVSVQKYFGFSFWVAVDRNIGNLYMALPVVLTGIYVSTGEVSFFKLAFGFVNLALSLLGPISMLLNIEFPKMQIEDSAKFARNFVRVSVYGVFLSLGLTLAAVIAAPFVFRILYGDSFLPSIKYIFGLFIYGALYGIGVGLGPMWRAINKVKVSIAINLIILGVGIPLGLLLIKGFGSWGSVIMVTLLFTVSHFISFIYLMRDLKLKYQNGK